MSALPALPPEDQPPDPDSGRVGDSMQRHPSQGGPVPRAVPLPAGLSATSLLLVPSARRCPVCSWHVEHAHCGSPGCCALWCVRCDLVFRPDTGAQIARGVPPKELGTSEPRPPGWAE